MSDRKDKTKIDAQLKDIYLLLVRSDVLIKEALEEVDSQMSKKGGPGLHDAVMLISVRSVLMVCRHFITALGRTMKDIISTFTSDKKGSLPEGTLN